jgi:hypothetical protein
MDIPELFLSYNSIDRSSVLAVQKMLEARGMTTFLDRDQLVPGLPWPQALEEGLRRVSVTMVSTSTSRLSALMTGVDTYASGSEDAAADWAEAC